MISKTKPDISLEEIQAMFESACLGEVKAADKLGDGEYNAVYDVETTMGRYVLKASPLDKTKVLTYEQDMMRGEVYWYAQLRTHTKIKVPYVYHKDFSHTVFPSDFFIMERMEGEQLNNAGLSKDEKAWCDEEIARMAAQIHKVTNDKYGYIQNELHDDWYSAIRSMVVNLIEDAQRAGKSTRLGQRLLKYIDHYKGVLVNVPCTMVNFDLWYGNILCVRKENGIELIFVDPERTMWGDALFEFANLDFTKPLNKKKITLKAYNSVAKTKINCTRNEMIRFAIGVAYLGLVQEVEKYYRYSPKYFGWWRNIIGSKFLFINAFRTLRKYE